MRGRCRSRAAGLGKDAREEAEALDVAPDERKHVHDLHHVLPAVLHKRQEEGKGRAVPQLTPQASIAAQGAPVNKEEAGRADGDCLHGIQPSRWHYVAYQAKSPSCRAYMHQMPTSSQQPAASVKRA